LGTGFGMRFGDGIGDLSWTGLGTVLETVVDWIGDGI
jgi:hypothetical protein